MGIQHFRLPDVGEGLVEAEIVSWKVKPGDTVKLNDTVVEIETAKSLVELPVPFAGTITELLVPEGETVPVGTPIIAVETESADEAAAAAEDLVPSIPEEDKTGGRTAVLVGYGPKTTEAKRRARKAPAGSAPAPAAGSAAPVTTPAPAAAHQLRNALTNVLGGGTRSVDVELNRLQIAAGDRLLLCSDGLTGTMTDEEIAGLLGRPASAADTCRGLVDLALERGAPDNVTVVVAVYEHSEGASRASP